MGVLGTFQRNFLLVVSIAELFMIITYTEVTIRNYLKDSSSFGNSGVHTQQNFIAKICLCCSVLMVTCSGDIMQQGLLETL